MNKAAAIRIRFGERVGNLLVRSGMTPTDLAVASNLSIDRIEKILVGGYVRITVAEMEIIANIVEASLHDLLAPGD